MRVLRWAGHKNVLKYLIEGAPENSRADATIVDKHGWSAVMWAVFMVEQENKMVGGEHGKRKQLCDVIQYLLQTVQGAKVCPPHHSMSPPLLKLKWSWDPAFSC